MNSVDINDVIKIEGGLKYFVNNIKIIVSQGSTDIDIVSYCPYLLHGITTYETIHSLLTSYTNICGYNEVWSHAFDGTVNAFYSNNNRDYGVKIKNHKNINTYEVIKNYLGYEYDDIDDIIHWIIYFNSTKIYFDETDGLYKIPYDSFSYDENNEDENSLEQIYLEFCYISDLSQVILELIYTNSYGTCNQLPLEEIVENLEIFNTSELLNLLYNIPESRLYVAIILNDVDKVKEVLNYKITDPRIDNNESYHLALKTKNMNIIKLIRDKILQLNWYEKEVIKSIFPGTLYSDILEHTKKYRK